MAGEIEACGLLLHSHPVGPADFIHFGNRNAQSGGFLVQHGEHAQLPLHIPAAAVCHCRHGRLIHRKQLASIEAKAIHGPAFDQIFHHPLVQVPLIHPLEKILQIPEGTAGGPLGDHGADEAPAHVLHRPQAEPDALGLYGELVRGVVDIRRQNRNLQLLTLGNVSGDFPCAVQDGGHERRHILPGIMILQIRRLIGHHGVANRVGLVEGIVAKIDNLIVDRLGHRLRDAPGHCAGNPLLFVSIDEHVALRLNDFLLLFGDGSPDVVRLAHGISGQGAENLNDLLLIDDAAVGHPENRLQKRGLIGDLLGIELVGNEFGNGIHGPWTIQGHNGGEIFNGRGLHAHAHPGHTCRLHLEHALGLPLGQHGVDVGIVIRNVGHGERQLRLPDLRFRLGNHRQVPQAQEVHLQKAQLLNGGHGVLGHHRVVIFGQGHVMLHRKLGDHHPGSVGGGIPGHALQGPGGVDEVPDPVVPVIHLLQLGGGFQSLVQGDVGGGRYQLGHHIRLPIGEVQRPAHIPDGAPGGHGTEGDNLGHMVGPILLHHVFNDFTPALLTKVGVKIRHAHPLRVQKPLEN